MRFWIVEDGALVEYERLGECRRCGQCCCGSLITFRLAAFTGDDVDEFDWSDNEGFSVLEAQGLIWYMKADVDGEARTCAALEEGACTIWMQDDFPAVCRYWPVHPANLEHFPDCGFSFRKV